MADRREHVLSFFDVWDANRRIGRAGGLRHRVTHHQGQHLSLVRYDVNDHVYPNDGLVHCDGLKRLEREICRAVTSAKTPLHPNLDASNHNIAQGHSLQPASQNSTGVPQQSESIFI